MRALREQPRVTAAKMLMVVTLVASGMAVGALLGEGDGKGAQATQARLSSAQRSLTGTDAELRVVRGRIERAETALDRARQDARQLARSNRQLRRELHAAERVRRQARRQR
jgi:chromosome segregation ATPase